MNSNEYTTLNKLQLNDDSNSFWSISKWSSFSCFTVIEWLIVLCIVYHLLSHVYLYTEQPTMDMNNMNIRIFSCFRLTSGGFPKYTCFVNRKYENWVEFFMVAIWMSNRMFNEIELNSKLIQFGKWIFAIGKCGYYKSNQNEKQKKDQKI